MSFLSSLWLSLKSAWAKFEAWVASWMPGLKTHVVTGLGAISMGAASIQEYISGLPLSVFMNVTQVAVLTTVLFTLAFWFHGLGDRVDARANSNT